MKRYWVLAGILAVSLSASEAMAQHQTPNQQPVTAPEATAPTGELALGTIRLGRAVTADGKPLPAGTYQVRLTAQAHGKAVRFAVEDTGEGIPAEHLPHLFEKFYRVPGSRHCGGAGLGLAIIREIVAAHGGLVDVASRPGEGTTFEELLPLARL